MHKANSGHLVRASPVADRLQQMTTAIEPSLSEGLIHLSSLFDSVMNYDENIGNSHDDENATLLIRTALQSASDSLNTTESISFLFLLISLQKLTRKRRIDGSGLRQQSLLPD